jgi:hypothetical protein
LRERIGPVSTTVPARFISGDALKASVSFAGSRVTTAPPTWRNPSPSWLIHGRPATRAAPFHSPDSPLFMSSPKPLASRKTPTCHTPRSSQNVFES